MGRSNNNYAIAQAITKRSCYMVVVSSISHSMLPSVSATVCTGRGESGEADVCMGRGASGEEADVTYGADVGRGGIIKSLAANPSPVGSWKLVLTMAVTSLRFTVGSPSSSSLFSAVLKSISTVWEAYVNPSMLPSDCTFVSDSESSFTFSLRGDDASYGDT